MKHSPPMLKTVCDCSRLPFVVSLAFLGGNSALGQVVNRDSIVVVNRKSLAAEKIRCERIFLGEADDYKPCIAQLPGGELLLTAFHQYKQAGGKYLEQSLLFRSTDGGRKWSRPAKLDLLGREPYLTVLKNGTVFITGHLLASDVRNKWGYTCGFIHRSTDGGKTWASTRIASEGIKPGAPNHSTRNVLALNDGTLLLGVDYDGGGGPYLVWRSKNNGKTWDKTGRCLSKNFKSRYGFFGGETWLWQANSGRILALVRVDSVELPIKGRPIKAKNDQRKVKLLRRPSDAVVRGRSTAKRRRIPAEVATENGRTRRKAHSNSMSARTATAEQPRTNQKSFRPRRGNSTAASRRAALGTRSCPPPRRLPPRRNQPVGQPAVIPLGMVVLEERRHRLRNEFSPK